MSKEQKAIGFIGCGGMAEAHCRSLGKLWEAGFRDFRVIAVCDLIEGKAAAMAGRFEEITGQRPAVYTDAAAMLAAERGLDSVLVITPHTSHHTLCEMAMEASVNVMVEKPVGITVRAAKGMMKVAQKTGKLLHVAENYRMGVRERAIHWAVTSGMIGQPRMLTWLDIGERKWYWDWRDHLDIAGGAWTLDGGVHHSDLFQYNLGPVKKVWAVSRTFDPVRYQKYESVSEYEQAKLEQRYAHFRQSRSLKALDPATLQEPIEVTVEDTTCAILEFDSGVVGTWMVSRAAPGNVDRSNAIYGSEGALFWHNGVYDAAQKEIYSREGLQEAFMAQLSPEQREIYFPRGVTDSLAIEWRQHFDALDGVRPVEVTAEIGLNAMVVPMAVYESAAIGAPVLIKDVLDLKVETYQDQFNKALGIK